MGPCAGLYSNEIKQIKVQQKSTNQEKRKINTIIKDIERQMKMVELKMQKNQKEVKRLMDNLIELEKNEQTLQTKKQIDLRKCAELQAQNENLKMNLEIYRKQKMHWNEYQNNEHLIQIEAPQFKRQRQKFEEKARIEEEQQKERNKIKDLKKGLAQNPEVDDFKKLVQKKYNERKKKHP